MLTRAQKNQVSKVNMRLSSCHVESPAKAETPINQVIWVVWPLVKSI